MTNRKALTIAIAGGSGFAGQALAVELLNRGHRVRILARSVANGNPQPNLETRQCDVFSLKQVDEALAGCDRAVYLIHSMLPNNRMTQANFEDLDVLVADNFARACRKNKIERIVYMGGIIPQGELSQHLRSRLEVERTLAAYGTPLVALRAGLVIGAGGSSYRILARLVKRLPVMVCPAWTRSRSNPVSLADATAALVSCCERDWPGLVNLHTKAADGPANEQYLVFNIGTRRSVSYVELMQTAARVYRRMLAVLTVPVNSYALSKLWVRFFSGASKTLVEPLVESLKHDMIAEPNGLPELLGREPQTLEVMLEQAEASKPVNLTMPRASASTDRSVRSVQRLNVPQGRDADWIARRYGLWLGRFFRGVIVVTRSQLNLVFTAKGVELLRLDYSPERSESTRALYYITGGALARKEPSHAGRLEFRLLPSGSQALAAIHDFEPALPWLVYANSQAPFHAWVMHRFRDYLRGRRNKNGDE
ncbi:MAG: NAD(P)H-binding protein [Turneriella sp.]